ncbi:MAG: 2-dehydropantoate 2-reductase [Candidatus Limnocylindria bacterium]
MKIAVFGSGAVGGYFGARLASAGSDVQFVARGENLAVMRERGLDVESVFGDMHLDPAAFGVTDDPASIGPSDMVLFTVKSYDTDAAAASLAPLLHARTGVISLQNGIDNEERIAGRIGAEHILGGAAFLFAHRAGPGHIRHTGGPARIVFGEMDGRRSERIEAFLAECGRARIAADVAPDIQVALWSKFVFLCAQAGLTAATREPIGVIRETPDTAALFRRVMEEIVSLGRAEGVALPDDLVERQLEFAASLEPNGRSSMYDDMVAGRPMELEALLGEVVRRGAQAGVATPVSETLYAVLLPTARDPARERSVRTSDATAATPLSPPGRAH